MQDIFNVSLILLWPLICCILFLKLDTVSAVFISLIGGMLFLPVGVEFDLPLVPAIDKNISSSLGAILGIPFAIKIGIRSKLTTFFKENVMIPALAKLRPNITYLPGYGITEETFNQSYLFNHPDRYSAEDLFQGIHEKTSFSFSEIHAEKKHKTKNGTSYSTIFKGLFMVAEWTDKDERQYEHIKDQQKKSGKKTDKAEEIAAMPDENTIELSAFSNEDNFP